MKTRFSLAVIAIIAAVLGLFSVAPAQAAASITKGSSCSLSANWPVAVSVNFHNTSGSPSTGEVNYVVLSSPGALDGTTDIQAYDPQGDYVSLGGLPLVRDYSKPGYVYRADPTIFSDNVRRVVFNPRAYTQYFCSDYSSKATVYSSN